MFMYSKGMKPEEIKERTGHRDINSLLYYVKIMELENLTEKFKEIGWKKALFITMFEILFAIFAGGLAFRLLTL